MFVVSPFALPVSRSFVLAWNEHESYSIRYLGSMWNFHFLYDDVVSLSEIHRGGEAIIVGEQA